MTMGDNDFPAVMGNGSMGFLQTYVKGMQDYQQAGTSIPDLRLQNRYAQESGGPLMQQTIAGVPDFDSRKIPFGESVYRKPVLPFEKTPEENIPFIPNPRA